MATQVFSVCQLKPILCQYKLIQLELCLTSYKFMYASIFSNFLRQQCSVHCKSYVLKNHIIKISFSLLLYSWGMLLCLKKIAWVEWWLDLSHWYRKIYREIMIQFTLQPSLGFVFLIVKVSKKRMKCVRMRDFWRRY